MDTLNQLSQLSGVSPKIISNYRRGEIRELRSAMKLATALKLTNADFVDFLLGCESGDQQLIHDVLADNVATVARLKGPPKLLLELQPVDDDPVVLDPAFVRLIRREHRSGMSTYAIARRHGLDQDTAAEAISGGTWSWVR